MNKKQTTAINPRLRNTVKRQRKVKASLLAFTRCTEALRGFDKKTQIVALRATAAILGFSLS